MTYLFLFCIGFLCCAVLDILTFNHTKSKLIKQLEKECKHSGNDVYNDGIIYALNEIKKTRCLL